jgi:ADP-ribose pyrophosphatase YjhB (NUDIX family)
MVTAANTILYQYGALPFSITEQGAIKVLLVTTRGRRNWIIPKGWPIRNLTAAATAAREAFEEAGLVGVVVGDEPFGSYRYEKPRNSRKVTTYEVSVFLFAVERQLRKWPSRVMFMASRFRTRRRCCTTASMPSGRWGSIPTDHRQPGSNGSMHSASSRSATVTARRVGA